MSDWEILGGDCIERMRQMDEASIDAIVTDPPYGIRFMGKPWDDGEVLARRRDQLNRNGEKRGAENAPGSNSLAAEAGVYDLRAPAQRAFQEWCYDWATEALRILKPGGHLLAFGGTRTYHRLACAVEDAGFEIRDSLIWLYGSGFPKSHNGDWGGTALKPSHEPVVMARKPLSGTVEQNWREYGTGALNIDGCRIEGQPPSVPQWESAGSNNNWAADGRNGEMSEPNPAGRWPANVALSPEAAAELDEQSGERASSHDQVPTESGNPAFDGGRNRGQGFNDSGGASRFFATFQQKEGEENDCSRLGGGDTDRRNRAVGNYSDLDATETLTRFHYRAKASRGERNAGLDGFEEGYLADANKWTDVDYRKGEGEVTARPRANVHPTVKPIDLMRWLVRLVTPPGGTVLDPFTGSGTTGIAAVLEGFDFIGIEREAEYVDIAKARIQWWSEQEGETEEILIRAGLSERIEREHAEAGQLGLEW